MTSTLTLIDGQTRHEVAVTGSPDDPVIFPSELGWELKPEGLCRDNVCVPLRNTVADEHGGLALADFARLTGRPAVVDGARSIAALGVSADTRREQLRSLAAPDFTLPDPQGNPVSLSDFGRRKRLLLAWSSW
jgi:hypothetical protein